jgi:putative ABC transport system permease protein
VGAVHQAGYPPALELSHDGLDRQDERRLAGHVVQQSEPGSFRDVVQQPLDKGFRRTERERDWRDDHFGARTLGDKVEADAIRKHVQSVDIVGAELWHFGLKIEYRDEEVESGVICGGTPEYPQNNTHFVAFGRNLTQMDVRAARKVAIIGYELARQLYPFVDPIGREIRIDGRKYEVIGVFDEKKSAFGAQYDNYTLIPVSTFVNTYGIRGPEGFERSVNVTVHARSPELVDDAIGETRQVLRRMRGLPHGEEDNFTIFNS